MPQPTSPVDGFPSTLPALPVVVVVDDDLLTNRMVADAIADVHCEVVGFASADEALTWLRAHPASVVVADQYLQGRTGLSLLRALREGGARPRRLLMTAHLDARLAVEAVNEAQVFRLLEKPLDRWNVRDFVIQALDALTREAARAR